MTQTSLLGGHDARLGLRHGRVRLRDVVLDVVAVLVDAVLVAVELEVPDLPQHVRLHVVEDRRVVHALHHLAQAHLREHLDRRRLDVVQVLVLALPQRHQPVLLVVLRPGALLDLLDRLDVLGVVALGRARLGLVAQLDGHARHRVLLDHLNLHGHLLG